LAACDKDDKDDNPVRDVRQAIEDRQLQGTLFEGECQLKPLNAFLTGLFSEGDGAVKSAKLQYQFKGNNLTRTTYMYTSTGCEGDPAFTMNETGTFAIQDGNTNDGGRDINLDYSKATAKAVGQAGEKLAEDIDLCGIQDWTAEEEKDVTINAKQATCLGAPVPRHVANVYRLENDGKTLYLGVISDSEVPDTQRPATLNREFMFTAKK
ncbi:MAG: hypothetical protein AB7P49_11365, partial [Bdellovibrionales bacterium]